MSSYITKEDCVEALQYYKEMYKDEDKAYSLAANSLDISEDRLIEIVGEDEE